MSTGQLGGIALGLALAGAIFVNEAPKNLQVLLPNVPRSTLQHAISGTSGTHFRTLPKDLQDQSTEVIVSAMGKTFIFVYVGAAVLLVLSALFTVVIWAKRVKFITNTCITRSNESSTRLDRPMLDVQGVYLGGTGHLEEKPRAGERRLAKRSGPPCLHAGEETCLQVTCLDLLAN